MGKVKDLVTEPMAQEILQQFYNAIGQWIDAGFPASPFSLSTGLCGNFLRYCKDIHGLHSDLIMEIRYELMSETFRKVFGEPNYPFNENHYFYNVEVDTNRVYQNKARIRWVQGHRNDVLPNHQTPN